MCRTWSTSRSCDIPDSSGQSRSCDIPGSSGQGHVTLLSFNPLNITLYTILNVQLRAEYASYLKHHQVVQQFLVTLFPLMPPSPLVHLKDRLMASSPGQKLTNSWNMFTEQPLLDIKGQALSLMLKTSFFACVPLIFYRHTSNKCPKQLANYSILALL